MEVEPVCTISDHKTIKIDINISPSRVIPETIKFRNKEALCSQDFSDDLRAKFDEFKLKLCPSDNNLHALECVNCCTKFYRSTKSGFFDKNAPVIEKKIKTKHGENKWYNGEIRQTKRNLRNAEKKLFKYNTEYYKSEFIRLRNLKCKLVHESKAAYYKNKIAECSPDPKKLYSLLNQLLGKNLKSIKFPTCESNLRLVNNFKDFFISKVSNINSSFLGTQASAGMFIPDFPVSGFESFRPINEAEMVDILRKMNKTNCSIDPYNIKFLDFEVVNSSLSAVFAATVNASFKSGIFPCSEKASIVRPLIKGSKDHDEYSSFRPLFNTTMLAKVLKKSGLCQYVEY